MSDGRDLRFGAGALAEDGARGEEAELKDVLPLLPEAFLLAFSFEPVAAELW